MCRLEKNPKDGRMKWIVQRDKKILFFKTKEKVQNKRQVFRKNLKKQSFVI